MGRRSQVLRCWLGEIRIGRVRSLLDKKSPIQGASGSNREAESTDAPERGGLPCSSDEAGVMLVERRGQVIAVGSEPTGNRRSSNSRRKAAAFVRWHEPDDARVSSPDLGGARGAIPRAYSAWLCENADVRKTDGRIISPIAN